MGKPLCNIQHLRDFSLQIAKFQQKKKIHRRLVKLINIQRFLVYCILKTFCFIYFIQKYSNSSIFLKK